MGNSHSESVDSGTHRKHDADHHNVVMRALHRVRTAFPSPTASPSSHISDLQQHEATRHSSVLSSRPSLGLFTPSAHHPQQQQHEPGGKDMGLQSMPASPHPPQSDQQRDRLSTRSGSLQANYQYCLPDNEHEQDRLINMHFVSKHTFHGNYASPIGSILQQPRLEYKLQPRVLDIACGTGTWLLEMASEFPNAQFFGIDKFTMYPSDIKPPNVHFVQGDVRTGLPYDDVSFDFIHMSYVYNCFSESDQKLLLQQIRRVLKPGGYVEFRDNEHFLRNAGPITNEFQKPFARVMLEQLDVDVTWASHMAEQLHLVAGMTDIHHQVVSVYFMSSSNFSDAVANVLHAELQSYGDFLSASYHLTHDEYERIVDTVIEECRRYRSFQNHVLVWARKRLIEDTTAANADRPSAAPSTAGSSGSPSLSHIPSDSSYSNRNDEKASDIYQFVHGYTE